MPVGPDGHSTGDQEQYFFPHPPQLWRGARFLGALTTIDSPEIATGQNTGFPSPALEMTSPFLLELLTTKYSRL